MNLFLKISTRSFLILLHVLRTHYSKQFSLAKLKFRVFSKWPRKASFPLILKKLSNFIHFKAQIRREYTWNRNHALWHITYLYIKNGIRFGLSKKTSDCTGFHHAGLLFLVTNMNAIAIVYGLNWTERLTDRRTDGWTDRVTNWLTDWPTDWLTEWGRTETKRPD